MCVTLKSFKQQKNPKTISRMMMNLTMSLVLMCSILLININLCESKQSKTRFYKRHKVTDNSIINSNNNDGDNVVTSSGGTIINTEVINDTESKVKPIYVKGLHKHLQISRTYFGIKNQKTCLKYNCKESFILEKLLTERFALIALIIGCLIMFGLLGITMVTLCIMYERVRFLHNKVTTILDLDKIPESTQWPARHEKGYVKFYDPNYDETEIPQPSSEYPSSLSHHIKNNVYNRYIPSTPPLPLLASKNTDNQKEITNQNFEIDDNKPYSYVDVADFNAAKKPTTMMVTYTFSGMCLCLELDYVFVCCHFFKKNMY